MCKCDNFASDQPPPSRQSELRAQVFSYSTKDGWHTRLVVDGMVQRDMIAKFAERSDAVAFIKRTYGITPEEVEIPWP